MQKMTPCLVRRGRTGPQSYRSRELVTFARPRNRATTAAAVARAGIKMSKKFNTESTKRKIYKYHEQWCRDNGYKPTSPQAKRRRNRGHKPRVQACSSFQAPEPGNQSTSVQAGPGHKLPG